MIGLTLLIAARPQVLVPARLSETLQGRAQCRTIPMQPSFLINKLLCWNKQALRCVLGKIQIVTVKTTSKNTMKQLHCMLQASTSDLPERPSYTASVGHSQQLHHQRDCSSEARRGAQYACLQCCQHLVHCPFLELMELRLPSYALQHKQVRVVNWRWCWRAQQVCVLMINKQHSCLPTGMLMSC